MIIAIGRYYRSRGNRIYKVTGIRRDGKFSVKPLSTKSDKLSRLSFGYESDGKFDSFGIETDFDLVKEISEREALEQQAKYLERNTEKRKFRGTYSQDEDTEICYEKLKMKTSEW